MPLHVELHGLAEAPPERKVVLVHGFTQTNRSWQPLLPRLTAGRQVAAVDAPGHGGSPQGDVDLVDGARLIGEAGGEAAYVGYSMGGRLALHLAVSQPRLVRRLVLIGATAGIDEDHERQARRAADEALAEELEREGVDPFLNRWLASPLFATLSEDDAGLDDRRRNTVSGLAASLRRMGTGTQEPLWDRLSELHMPALLVAGERDEKFTAMAHRLAAAWGGDARVAVVPGAGHACHLERPDAFCDLVIPFLDGGMAVDTAAPQ